MDKCLCGHSLHTVPCEVCGCERVKMDDATQLDYALTRLRLCIVENDALAQYPTAVLRDDMRLALVELARLSVENARLSLDRRAAWANGQTLKEECERAAQVAEDVAEAHRVIGIQGRFTADYRQGAVDAAMHIAHLLRHDKRAGDAGVGE